MRKLLGDVMTNGGNIKSGRDEVSCGGAFLRKDEKIAGVYRGELKLEKGKMDIVVCVGKMDEWMMSKIQEESEKPTVFSIHTNRSESPHSLLFGERVISAAVNGHDLIKISRDMETAVGQIRKCDKNLPQNAICPAEIMFKRETQ